MGILAIMTSSLSKFSYKVLLCVLYALYDKLWSLKICYLQQPKHCQIKTVILIYISAFAHSRYWFDKDVMLKHTRLSDPI